MSKMIANVERLKALVLTRKAEDEAKVAAAQAEYDAALDTATKNENSVAKFVAKWIAQAISTKKQAGPLTNGKITIAGGYVSATRYHGELSVSVQLPAGTEVVDLPFNPAEHTPEQVASRLGTKTPEFHDRTVQVLDVNEGESIEIDVAQFNYYL